MADQDDRKNVAARSPDMGASSRAVSIGRVIDRLCRAPGTYQITVTVPVHRRSPWQITYARLEIARQEVRGRQAADDL